jgi:signal transduction histidine kinase
MDAWLTHDISSLVITGRNLSQTLHQFLVEDKYQKEDLLSLTNELKENDNEILKLISSIKDELKQQPRYSFVSIKEMVNQAVKITRHSNLKKFNLTKRFSDNLPAIRVEKTRFVLVLVNLLQNAVDSFKETGEIEITSFAKDSKITLEIKDNGCGIPDDEKEKIFSGFHSTKEDNTGLGLFFAKQEIQRYGGDITCVSEPSVGTTMIITLPYQEDRSDKKTGT